MWIKNSICIILISSSFYLLPNLTFAKPSVPISGEFKIISENIEKSKDIELSFTFSIQVPFELMGVSLTLPKGVSLIEGRKIEKIKSLKVNEVRKFKYKIRINENKQYRIMMTVDALGLVDSAFGRDFIIDLNSDSMATSLKESD